MGSYWAIGDPKGDHKAPGLTIHKTVDDRTGYGKPNDFIGNPSGEWGTKGSI